MVCFHQIYCGEDFPASKLLCKIGNVPNEISVGDGPSVQSTIVATGSPPVFFLGDGVEGRITGAIRTPSSAFWSISLNSDFAIQRQSGASHRGHEVAGGTGVV